MLCYQVLRLYQLVVYMTVLVLIVCPPAKAQISVSPLLIDDLTVYPGGLKTFTLIVGSRSEEIQDCTIKLSAMTVEGGGLPVPVESSPRSCHEWITVKPDSFALPPGSSRRIICQIRVPRETVGGYYTLVSCLAVPRGSAVTNRNEGVSAGISFRHSQVIPILLTVPGPEMRAIIDAADPVMIKNVGSLGYTIKLPLRNRGNVHARIHGTADIQSEVGQPIEKFELASGRGFVLPEHERLFTSEGKINLSDGVYVANFRLELENTRWPMEKTFSFYVYKGIPHVAKLTEELRSEIKKQAAGFIVNPSNVMLSVNPGGRRTEVVELVNLTNDMLRIVARTAEWYRTFEGQDLVAFESAPHGHSAINVITVNQPAIELPPRIRKRVPIMIEVPRGATGERYAAICFDRIDGELDQAPESRARRSTTVGIRAEGTGENNAEIVSLKTKRNAKGAFDLEVRYRNTGEISFAPEISFIIRNVANETVDRIRITEQLPFVQAGGEGVLSREWAKVVEPGEYRAETTLYYSPNKPPLTARTNFTVPEFETPITDEKSNETKQ